MSDIETLHTGSFLRFRRDGVYEFVDRPNCSGAVAVIGATDDNEVILVEQYRPALSARVIEPVAGLSGDIPGEEDEAFELAARREFEEEAGYSAETFELALVGPSSAGMSSELIHFYVARGLTKVSDGGGDHTEDIVVHRVPLATVDHWLGERLASGVMVDPKVYSCLHFLLRER